jgi:hypothetical protein
METLSENFSGSSGIVSSFEYQELFLSLERLMKSFGMTAINGCVLVARNKHCELLRATFVIDNMIKNCKLLNLFRCFIFKI